MARSQGGRQRKSREEKEFDQRVIDIARVTRVMKGGKRMRFRACMVIGDKRGRVAIAVAKGADVAIAINKAVTKAKKNFIKVPIVDETIPHQIREKFGAARILLKRAPRGTGIKAGGVMRTVLELAGIPNVIGKMLGGRNKVNNVTATINALGKLKKVKVEEQEKSREEGHKEKEKEVKIDKDAIIKKQDTGNKDTNRPQ